MARKDRKVRFNALLTNEAGQGFYGTGATEKGAVEDARETAVKRGADPDGLSESVWSTGGPGLKVVEDQDKIKGEKIKRKPPPKDRPGYEPPGGGHGRDG
jgi:hypothetical protein